MRSLSTRRLLHFFLVMFIAAQSAAFASTLDPFEEMMADVDSEEAYLELLNLIDTALKEPVNLLEADTAELRRLPWVSPAVADGIMKLRRQGRLRKIEDLEGIDGVDARLVELLRPFVTIESPKRHITPFKASARLRVISCPATGDFEGLKTYLRSEVGYGVHRLGLVLEKDKSETDADDFKAYYLATQWRWARITIGDFILISGHGLVFSNPYAHSPSTVNPWRFSQGRFGIGPYTSVDENFAMRGAGVSLVGKRFGICIAASAADFDAALDEDGKVRSLRTSGYHATERELEAKDRLREDLLAIAARVGTGPLEVRFNLAYADFGRPFGADAAYGLSQKGNLIGSLDMVLGNRRRMVFVEAAASRHGDEAFIGGIAFDTASLELLVMGRSYGRRYSSLHARPFASYSGTATGEQGVLARLTFKPVPNGLLSVASDLHKKSGSDEATSDPSGSETFLNFELKTGDFLITLGEKITSAEEPPPGEGSPTEQRRRFRSRIDIRYAPSTTFWVRARYENLHATEKRGPADERFLSDLVRLDSGLSLAGIIDLKGGIYTFTIDDYASRLYQYEAGLPYYPTLQMLKTNGSRWYSVISCGKNPYGRLVAKFGRTTYDEGTAKFELLFYYNVRL